MSESMDQNLPEDEGYRDAGEAVFAALLDRVGEAAPRPRLGPTRRVVELLGERAQRLVQQIE